MEAIQKKKRHKNSPQQQVTLPFVLTIPSRASEVVRTEEELTSLRRREEEFFKDRGISTPLIAGHNTPYSSTENTSYQTSAGTTTPTADSTTDYSTAYKSDTKTDYSWDDYG